MPVNCRWDEFKNLDLSIRITGESITVPATGDPYVRLAELPKDAESLVVYDPADAINQGMVDDTWAYEGMPGQKYNSSPFLAVGRDDAGTFGSKIYRAFLHPDLTGLPESAGKVILWLYCETGHSRPVIRVHRATSAWSAASVDWANQPSYNLVPEASTNIDQLQAWYGWDVTAWYNSVMAGATNYGLVMTSDEVHTDTVHNFTSLDSGGWFQPHLMVIGSAVPFENVSVNTAPLSYEVAVSVPTGRLRFNPDKAGQVLSVDYTGTGSPATIEDL